MRGNVTSVVVTVLLFALVLGAIRLESDRTVKGASTIVVPDDYATIQDAINNAVEGDTISVKTGTYYEHVTVDKSISLVGEGASATIIDGNGTGHVIHVVSDSVNVTGFTVQRGGSVQLPALDAGICLNGTTGCTMSGNRVIDNGFCGISLLYSQQNRIANNNVSRTGWVGIHMMGSSYNVVSWNILDSNAMGGINGHASSHYNNITDNVISNSPHGMFYHDAIYNNICRNNISFTAVDGIWLQDQVSYNTVTGNNLVNNTVAIRLEGPNYNNILSRNIITGAENGIRILNAQYTRIADNIIVNNRAGSDSWRAGIRLEYGGDTQIYSNDVRGNYRGILLYSNSPRVSVYGNNITENEFGLRVAEGGSHYLNVTWNLVANNTGYGIGVTGFGGSSNYATISQNTIINNSDGIALGQYSGYNTIVQNNLTDNDCGLYSEYSNQNLISDNNITACEYGVKLDHTSTNVVQDNNITGSYVGVTAFYSTDTRISDNIIADNHAGIDNSWYTTRSIISRNWLVDNNLSLHIHTSDSNTIFKNNVTGNGIWGVEMWYSRNNKLFHNNFVGNALHANMCTPGYVNFWDNGYPSGGNYWSGYAGTDGDGDGIGDSPYTVDASNGDRHPLIGAVDISRLSDLALVQIMPLKTFVGQGYQIRFNLTVTNEGASTETFNLTLSVGSTSPPTLAATITVWNLLEGETRSVTVSWNTSGWAKANYTLITAGAAPRQGEADTADNTLSGGWVFVSIPGDTAEPYRLIDIFDVVGITGVYESGLGDPEYKANSDIDGNGIIDIFDVVACTSHYEESW